MLTPTSLCLVLVCYVAEPQGIRPGEIEILYSFKCRHFSVSLYVHKQTSILLFDLHHSARRKNLSVRLPTSYGLATVILFYKAMCQRYQMQQYQFFQALWHSQKIIFKSFMPIILQSDSGTQAAIGEVIAPIAVLQ